MSVVSRLKLPERLFALSGLLAVFGYGVAVGQFQLFPYSILEFGWNSVQQVYAERQMMFGTRPTDFLEPARYEGSGVTVSRPSAAPGLTLLSGFFEGGNQIRLIRLDGTVVNKWPVEYLELFPNSDHIQPREDVPKTNWNTSVHGVLPLPDGSIVFNFTYKGAVRLDRCGNTAWTLNRMAHHTVMPSQDGSFWILGARYQPATTGFPNLRPPYVEDTIMKVSPAGQVQKEISIAEVLYRNNLQGMLFWRRGTGDVTHTNDVEELTPELASRFPMFAPGDLVVSMRVQHMIFVVDPESLVVKWFQVGPWIGQHDPDFTDSGRISVFNNNNDSRRGALFGGSNIVEVAPASHAVSYRYGTGPEQRMFTYDQGKHQPLPDGHLLVTETRAGRAFEVDESGRVVWEFVNRYDESDAALLTEASRYPERYFTVTDWSCGG